MAVWGLAVVFTGTLLVLAGLFLKEVPFFFKVVLFTAGWAAIGLLWIFATTTGF